MSYYKISDFFHYTEALLHARNNPEEFWEQIAEENFVWRQKWDKVLDFDFTEPRVEWFINAKLNITENCIDRHLADKADQVAIIFEPDDPSEAAQHITYQQLSENVNRWANLLRAKGVTKGDRVCIYLPMIPDLAYACLACARIGAIHSVVFAGFSSTALSTRINDCDAKFVITSDGGYRGGKVLDLKSIVNEALQDCAQVECVLTVKRTGNHCEMQEGRDEWVADQLAAQSTACEVEVMDAEDPLFILYTSGSTGQPKGMVHSTAGYMVYTAFTFKNVFRHRAGDVYWCSADIGWITGHSYIIYGPLANGATTVMFEGVPSYPDFGRFWQVIEKHKVTQFYTAPTAIRALAKESLDYVSPYDLSTLKVLGSVGEPINEEAWHWYNDNIGKGKAPIVDTWWQTETGGILISPLPFITPTKPTYATMPMLGVSPVLMDENGKEITEHPAEGRLALKYPWPSIARTIWGNHQRYKDTYFSAYEGKYFTGDGAKTDEVGFFRITGRVDDVIIVSGHNLGTAPIEDAINEHQAVAESAIVGYPHDIKGNALYGYVVLKEEAQSRLHENVRKEINQKIREMIGPIAKLDKIQFVAALPKTRSGKIMRRILRKIAEGETSNFGDVSTLLNPECVEEILSDKL